MFNIRKQRSGVREGTRQAVEFVDWIHEVAIRNFVWVERTFLSVAGNSTDNGQECPFY